MHGSDRCFFHSEDAAVIAKRNLARSKGGKSHHPYPGDAVGEAIEAATDTLKQFRAQLATKKHLTGSDVKKTTDLLNSIVNAKESSILQRLKDAASKNSKT